MNRRLIVILLLTGTLAWGAALRTVAAPSSPETVKVTVALLRLPEASQTGAPHSGAGQTEAIAHGTSTMQWQVQDREQSGQVQTIRLQSLILEAREGQSLLFQDFPAPADHTLNVVYTEADGEPLLQFRSSDGSPLVTGGRDTIPVGGDYPTVLGSVVETAESSPASARPGLGSLPIVGRYFRSSNSEQTATNYVLVAMAEKQASK